MLGSRLDFNLNCSIVHFKDSSIELSTCTKEENWILSDHKILDF